MKRDILNTVADRCEILFEDLLLNEVPEKKVMSIKLRTFYVCVINTVIGCQNVIDMLSFVTTYICLLQRYGIFYFF